MNPQFLMDGLIAGAIIGLGAVGVTLTYSILRFSNFAHGELLSWGAYLALGISSALGVLTAGLTTPIGPFSFGWSLPIAAVLAVALTGLLALAVDAALFSSFRRRGSAIIIMVMASFGASLALRSLLGIPVHFEARLFQPGAADCDEAGLGLRATPDQLAMLAVALVSVIAVHLVMTRTISAGPCARSAKIPALPVSPASMFAGSYERPGSWAPHLPASPAS